MQQPTRCIRPPSRCGPRSSPEAPGNTCLLLRPPPCRETRGSPRAEGAAAAPPAAPGAVPVRPSLPRDTAPPLRARPGAVTEHRSRAALREPRARPRAAAPRARQLLRKRTKTQTRVQRELPLLKVCAALKLKRRCPRHARASRGGARGGLEPHTEVPSAGCASFLLSSGFMAGKSNTSCNER